MRIICLSVLVLLTSGCSQSDDPEGTGSTSLLDSSLVTLTDLVYVDDQSAGYQHPLVCGPGGDFPAGQELVFKYAESDNFVHVVFPEEIGIPNELQGSFMLQGHFQRIQNRSRYSQKIPPEDYSYFVVSSWEYSL